MFAVSRSLDIPPIHRDRLKIVIIVSMSHMAGYCFYIRSIASVVLIFGIIVY